MSRIPNAALRGLSKHGRQGSLVASIRIAATATLLTASLLAAASCSSRSSKPVSPAAAPANVRAAAETTRHYDLDTGGRKRSYLLHVPPSYDGKPMPLLVALHPALSTPELMEKATHFDTLADSNGFIVAYPEGISKRWNAGKCCGEPMDKGVDDVGFVNDMVRKIAGEYAIDPARHYVAGFSNGAFLVHHIACLEPDEFAAYATVAGTLTTPECRDAKPTAFLLINGMADDEVAWKGGERWGYNRPAVPDVLQRLARRNQCQGGETVTDSDTPATCKRFNGCVSELDYCTLEGVGHQWPGSGQTVWPWLLGPNTDKFDASQRIWDFFAEHPKS